jgi:hypothetical protein
VEAYFDAPDVVARLMGELPVEGVHHIDKAAVPRY